MKKTSILLILTFSLFLVSLSSVSVNAALTDGLLAYYSFDNTAQNSVTNNYHFTTWSANYNTSAKLGSHSAQFVAASSNHANTNTSLGAELGTTNTFTATWWQNNAGLGANNGIWGFQTGTSSSRVFWNEYDNKIYARWNFEGSPEYSQYFAYISTNTWNFMAYRFNGTHGTTFVNNEIKNNVAYSTNQDFSSLNFHVGRYYAGGWKYFLGRLDEFGIWERALTDTELTSLYNSGDGLAYPFSSVVTPSLTLSTNITNGSKFGFIKIPDGNFTFTTSGVSVNNSNNYNLKLQALQWNGLTYLNQTTDYGTVDLSTAKTLSFNFLDFFGGALEDWINISVIATNENASDIKSYMVYFDGINPEITVTNIVNNSLYYKNISASYFNYSATFADTNLYAYNITLKNATGHAYFNNFTTSITTLTYSLNQSFNLTNYTTGAYSLIFEVWDSHTANQVKPLEWYYDGNNLITDGDLKFIGDFKTLDAKSRPATYFYYSGDRYKFKVTFNNQALTHTIRLQTPKSLELVSNSNYKGHFVYWGAVSPRWIDFESDNVASVSVIKNAANDYTLTVTHYTATDEIEFNSIGDLNKVTEIYNFTLNNPFYLYANDNNTLATISDFGAVIYNATERLELNTSSGVIPVPIISGFYNITFFASSYLNRTYSNISMTPNGNMTGSLNGSGAFTLYIKNQINLALINQLVTLEFVPVTANTSKNYTTSTGVKYINDLDAGEWIIRYSSANYSDAFYYFTLVNGTSETFTIYMLPASDTTNVTAYVYDEVANVVKDAIIHVQRYDLNTNSYLTVEIVKTNFEGRSIIHITKNTEFYKFLIYYLGDLKLSTESSYIYDDTITFQIQLGDVFAENFYKARGVDYSLYYNPSTYNVGFTYANAENTITNGTLKLYNVTGGTRTLYNLSSIASTSGTILLYARNISGTTYIGEAWVTINGVEQYLNSISVVYITESDQNLQEDGSALFYLLLLCVVFAFVGFYDLTVAVILTPLPIVIGSLLGFISIAPFIAVPIEILAIIVAIMININK